MPDFGSSNVFFIATIATIISIIVIIIVVVIIITIIITVIISIVFIIIIIIIIATVISITTIVVVVIIIITAKQPAAEAPLAKPRRLIPRKGCWSIEEAISTTASAVGPSCTRAQNAGALAQHACHSYVRMYAHSDALTRTHACCSERASARTRRLG